MILETCILVCCSHCSFVAHAIHLEPGVYRMTLWYLFADLWYLLQIYVTDENNRMWLVRRLGDEAI